MATDEQAQELAELAELLTLSDEQLTPEIRTGLELGSRLSEGAGRIGESSSNSWAGWHSRMYYGDYEEPPVRESWDVEWGGLHGFSDLWRERSYAEIQEAIETAAGTTVAELSEAADRARLTCEQLQREVVTVLSPVCDRQGFEREADLLRKIEGVEWITTPSKYIQALTPRQYMSRDSSALSQGLQPPMHMRVEAVIVSNITTLKTCRTFLDDARRVTRQAQTKLRASSAPVQMAPTSGGGDAQDTQPPMRNPLERRLHVVSGLLFGILSVSIVGGLLYVLRTHDLGSLGSAVAITIGGLLVFGLYALLLHRGHALRALGFAAGAAGAIAALDQLLGHFD